MSQQLEPQTQFPDDGLCVHCGELTQSLSGNPTLWRVYIPRTDGSGKNAHWHIGCIVKTLSELAALKAELESVKAERDGANSKKKRTRKAFARWSKIWRTITHNYAVKSEKLSSQLSAKTAELEELRKERIEAQQEWAKCMSISTAAIIAREADLAAHDELIRKKDKALREEWSPIESAPKGEKILVTHLPAMSPPAPVMIAWFSNQELKHGRNPWCLSHFKRLRWKPTHWRSLPRPNEASIAALTASSEREGEIERKA